MRVFMQVTELESKGLKKNFRITVDADQINQQTEAELRAAGEKVKIPGFRPGYIPMKVLQQRYGKSVQADVIKQVINKASTDVVVQKKLRPTLMPQINIENYEEGGSLTFTMNMEVFPETPEVDFTKITLDRKTFEVDEKDVDEAMQRVAERSPQFEKAKDGAKAAKGNVVTIDFKGSIDGKLFTGGSANDFRLELGAGQFIEGYEDQLIGAKVGETRMVEVKFPDDYPGAEVAGKPASFETTIKEIHEKTTPTIDEEFAKARGFGDLRALREAIRNQLIREYDSVVRNQLKKELFDKLEEATDIELPEGMVDMEFNSIWEHLEQAKARGDESVAGKSDDELKKEYRAIAERRVKLGLLLADVGTRNKIQISRDELSRAVVNQAQQFQGQEKKVMEFYRNNPERMEDLRGPILEEKAVNHILSKVKYNDQKVTLEELIASENEDESEGDSKKKPKAKAKKKA